MTKEEKCTCYFYASVLRQHVTNYACLLVGLYACPSLLWVLEAMAVDKSRRKIGALSQLPQKGEGKESKNEERVCRQPHSTYSLIIDSSARLGSDRGETCNCRSWHPSFTSQCHRQQTVSQCLICTALLTVAYLYHSVLSMILPTQN